MRSLICRIRYFSLFSSKNIGLNEPFKPWQNLTNKHLLYSVKHCSSDNGYERDFDVEKELDKLLNDEEYQEIVPVELRKGHIENNVLFIQPRIKFGPEKAKVMKLTSPELQLEEGVALVETLKNWSVVDRIIVPAERNTKKPLIFGSGTTESLKGRVNSNSSINGIVLGIDMLFGHQQAALEEFYGLPIYDRYSLVLQIFNENARSRESKLQIALAEIPYVRTRLKELTVKGRDRPSGVKGSAAGSGESYLSTRRRLLNERELKLRKAIDKLKQNRGLLRQRRAKKLIPCVAVVGYTNSGKTTLIKTLTDDTKLVPKDSLFATLDVTVHSGSLPTLKQVLYVDTVGFISNIPTGLIEAFKATLNEVALADLIVHVQDISHPDVRNQNETVQETLKELNVGEKLEASMLRIGNKVDLINTEDKEKVDIVKPHFLISATSGINVAKLRREIEKKLIINTGRYLQMFRVPSGGEEYQFLHKEASLREATVDPDDNNFLFVDVLINEAAYGKFKRLHGERCIISDEDTRIFKKST
ncbi:putative GTP-binding protein 6 [Halotydeus destructor]|nr:putative GTP-binding protein 6 [Halotydeus destructor]